VGYVGATGVIISSIFFTVRSRCKLKPISQLSGDANVLLERYGHYFLMPFASKDYSASAATIQFAGVAMGIIGCFTGFWWGLALALVNWLAMGLVAVGQARLACRIL
jgi:hypothetical protein